MGNPVLHYISELRGLRTWSTLTLLLCEISAQITPVFRNQFPSLVFGAQMEEGLCAAITHTYNLTHTSTHRFQPTHISAARSSQVDYWLPPRCVQSLPLLLEFRGWTVNQMYLITFSHYTSPSSTPQSTSTCSTFRLRRDSYGVSSCFVHVHTSPWREI